MTIKAHLAELERQHKALEHELAEALAHSSTDDLKIMELKRRKLILKDTIAGRDFNSFYQLAPKMRQVRNDFPREVLVLSYGFANPVDNRCSRDY
jgi:hypothetical protein